MSNFTAADVKKLRDLTGAGMLDCKKALEEAGGDFDKAVEILRIKGAKDVGKRAGRTTANGLVAHSGRALLELNCETDFVAKNADFIGLAQTLVEHRSEEHTSELQSQSNLVCRLLLEKKKQSQIPDHWGSLEQTVGMLDFLAGLGQVATLLHWKKI